MQWTCNAVGRWVVVLGAAAALVALGTGIAHSDEAGGAQAEASPKKLSPLITVSKETTYITEPLGEDGYVDYLAAVNQRLSEGVAPQNNAAVPWWQAMGPAEIDEQHRAEFFRMLGTPVPAAEGDYFVTPRAFGPELRRRRTAPPGDGTPRLFEESLDAAQQSPWGADQHPDVLAWLKRNEKPLAMIAEGSRRPRYYTPLVSDGEPAMIGALLPGLGLWRDVGRALTARAMWHAGEGRPAEALSDLLTVRRVGRLAGQGATLIDALVAVGIDGMAGEAEVRLAHMRLLDKRQALAHAAQLRQLPPLPRMAEKVDLGERFMFLDAVGMLARRGPHVLAEISGGRSTDPLRDAVSRIVGAAAIDWNETCRVGNQWYDKLVAAMKAPTYAERTKLASKLDEDLRELMTAARQPKSLLARLVEAGGSPRVAIGSQIGRLMLAILTPAINMADVAEFRAEVRADLAQVALALAAYRHDHGEYPAELAALAPEYLPAVPPDRFADAPLKYRRQADGYLLYSVGPDQADDGGAEEEGFGGDIAIRAKH